jgi:ATP-dependent exoDNAse (exonuclease V) beta subunit
MMLECNAVDFDDLLVHVARLIIDNPELRSQLDARHRWILVDEYQDTNAAQYAIVRGLSIDHPNLSVTGDPDSVRDHRAFYIVDRSIPVGFEEGRDHNVWDCVRVRRIIE